MGVKAVNPYSCCSEFSPAIVRQRCVLKTEAAYEALKRTVTSASLPPNTQALPLPSQQIHADLARTIGVPVAGKCLRFVSGVSNADHT